MRTMLEQIEIYQQPSGFADGVIVSWITEKSAERVPQAIHQRDLFAGAMGESAKRAAYLSHQAQAWVGGKMTAVLQLTDTDIAFPMKAGARNEMDKMKAEMRDEAVAMGTVESFKCGPKEVLRVAYAAHMRAVENNARDKVVLAGSRRNGMLSFRPSMGKGRLMRSDCQAWAQELPEGGHRYPKDWLRERYEWLGESGRALKPKWAKCGPGVGAVEDMMDVEASGPPGCKSQLATWATMSEMRDGIEEPMLTIECDSEKLDQATCFEIAELSRRQVVEAALTRLASHAAVGGTEPAEKKAQYRRKRNLARKAVRKALKAWRYEQKAMLKNYSRRELLRTLIPASGSMLKRLTKGSAEGLPKKVSKDIMSIYNELPPPPPLHPS